MENSGLTKKFRGTAKHKIDAKGRISIPPDFRRAIETGDPSFRHGDCGKLTIVYGDSRQNFLECFTEAAVAELDHAIDSLDRSSAERQYLEHFFHTCAVQSSLDPNGRLFIPAYVRQKVKLSGEAVLAGTGDTFKIWRPDDFSESSDSFDSMYREGGEALNPMVLVDQARFA